MDGSVDLHLSIHPSISLSIHRRSLVLQEEVDRLEETVKDTLKGAQQFTTGLACLANLQFFSWFENEQFLGAACPRATNIWTRVKSVLRCDVLDFWRYQFRDNRYPNCNRKFSVTCIEEHLEWFLLEIQTSCGISIHVLSSAWKYTEWSIISQTDLKSLLLPSTANGLLSKNMAGATIGRRRIELLFLC